MKSIYLLLGEKDSRKSSTVRSLLGVDNPATQRDVQCVTGAIVRIRGLIGAAQERSLFPRELVKDLNGNHWGGIFSNVRNALVPLRYDTENGCPSAEDYIHELIKDGWSINCAVSLGEEARDWLIKSGLPYLSIANSRHLPTNVVAEKVRTVFGWI